MDNPVGGTAVERDSHEYQDNPEVAGVREAVEPPTLIRPKSATGDTLQKLVAEILAAWRRAERLASTLPAESPEHEAAERACNRLRDAYQELTHSGVAEALTAAEAKMLLRDAASDVDP
jgi:hypothetical protein